MLKHFLPFVLFLLLFSAAEAQVIKANQHYRAGLRLKDAQPAEALAEFTRATQLNKNFDSAYLEMGNIYFKTGKMDSAIFSLRKAIGINPKYADALFSLGKIYRDAQEVKQLDSALKYFTEAANYDPRNKEIFYGIAWIYNARKEHNQAIPYAVKALEIDNNYKPAYGELGYAYNSTKQYAACIEQMKKNLAVSVVDVAYLYSGYCYIELKNKEAAMQQYEALLKINERMAGNLKRKIDAMPAN